MVRSAPKALVFSNRFAPLADPEEAPMGATNVDKKKSAKAEKEKEKEKDKGKKAKAEAATVEILSDSDNETVDNEIEFPIKMIKSKEDARKASMMRKGGASGSTEGLGVLTYGCHGERGHLEY